MDDFIEYVKSEYSDYGPQHSASFTANASELSLKQTSSEIGYRCKKSDQSKLVIVTTMGFSFHQMRPYESWDIFHREARRLWDIYRSVVKPEYIQRLGLRYTNKIVIPEDHVNISDYLNVGVTVPEAFLPIFKQYSVQMALNIGGECRLTAVVQSGNAIPDIPDTVALVLDIDMSQSEDVSQNDSDIWSTLDIMRERKNIIFEGCITPQSRELFK